MGHIRIVEFFLRLIRNRGATLACRVLPIPPPVLLTLNINRPAAPLFPPYHRCNPDCACMLIVSFVQHNSGYFSHLIVRDYLGTIYSIR